MAKRSYDVRLEAYAARIMQGLLTNDYREKNPVKAALELADKMVKEADSYIAAHRDLSIAQLCRLQHVQDCSNCLDFECVDNVNMQNIFRNKINELVEENNRLRAKLNLPKRDRL